MFKRYPSYELECRVDRYYRTDKSRMRRFFGKQTKKKRKSENLPEYGSCQREIKVHESYSAYSHYELMTFPKEVHITVYDIEHFVVEINNLQTSSATKNATEKLTFIHFKRDKDHLLTYESNALKLLKLITLHDSKKLCKHITSKYINISLVEIAFKEKDQNQIISKFLTNLNMNKIEIRHHNDSITFIKYIKYIKDVLIIWSFFNDIYDLPRTYMFDNLSTLTISDVRFKSKYIKYSFFKVLKYLKKLSKFYILINNSDEVQTDNTLTYSGIMPSMKDKIKEGVSKDKIMKNELFGIFSNQIQCKVNFTRYLVKNKSYEIYLMKLLRRVKSKIKYLPSNFFQNEYIINYLS